MLANAFAVAVAATVTPALAFALAKSQEERQERRFRSLEIKFSNSPKNRLHPDCSHQNEKRGCIYSHFSILDAKSASKKWNVQKSSI